MNYLILNSTSNNNNNNQKELNEAYLSYNNNK